MKISVKIIPNARESKVIEDEVDLLGARILKIKVNQPPEDGRANKAMIDVLANYFEVKKNTISILAGATSRNKIIQIN